MANLKSNLSYGQSKIQLVIWPKIQNQVTFFSRNRSYFVAIPSKMREKKHREFNIPDLDLRIARIDPSRQVSMDEPRENENELTGIANIAC